MKVYYQIQKNDCGVSVIRSLVEHFYGYELPYPQIFSIADLDDKGINIANLEKLAHKFGFNLNSYACEFKEFLELKNYKYYIILRKTESFLHYCVVYKLKKKYLLYDSNEGIKELNQNELEQNFSGIILTIEKRWKKFPKNKSDQNLKIKNEISLLIVLWKNNLPRVITIVLISIFVIFLTIVNSQLFKFVLTDTIVSQQLQNLSAIALSFMVSMTIEVLLIFSLKFIQEELNWKINYSLQLLLHKKLCNSKLSLLKIDENVLFQLPNHVGNISQFVSFETTNFLTECFFIITLLFVLPLISTYLLFSFLIILVLNIILDTICFFWNRQQKTSEQQITDEQISNWKKMLNYFKNENDVNKGKILNDNWTENLAQQCNFYYKMFFFSNTVNSFRKFIQVAINFLNIIIGAILIVRFNYLHLEQLISGIFIIGFFLNYCGGISKFIFNFQQYKIWALRFLIYFHSNEKVNNANLLWPNEIKQIELDNIVWEKPKIDHWSKHYYVIKNDTIIFGENGIGKTTLCHTLSNKLSLSAGQIKINDNALTYYQNVRENIVLTSSKSVLEEKLHNKIFSQLEKFSILDRQKIIAFLNSCNLLRINNLNLLSSGQIQIMNWFYLLTLENKLIICDESLNFVSQQFKQRCIEIFKPFIIKKNFLIVIEHDKSIRELFQHAIELHKI